MEKQQISKLCRLADLVGDFIRYWGFRKIHGEIWTLVYLSTRPLSGAEIVKILKVSKALVSPALKELEQEGLLFQVESENSKTKRYSAEEDVGKIIRKVLHRREKPMLEKITKGYQELATVPGKEAAFDEQRLEKLGAMIETAQAGLNLLTESDQIWS